MSDCAFDWCGNTGVDHKEHTWTDGVDASSLAGKLRRVAVWNSIEDGFAEPIMISIEGSPEESDDGYEAWLSVEAAEQLRDALGTAIANAREGLDDGAIVEPVNEPIRSFSGTHAWDPSVLVDTDAYESDTADEIIESIAAGRCPRCEGPLPTMPEFPAGSRITKCRSIPICGRCGGDEVYEQVEGALSSAGCWPLPIGEIEERRSRHESRLRPATLSDGVLLTEDGVTPVVNPRDTGGWAQYGFRDE